MKLSQMILAERDRPAGSAPAAAVNDAFSATHVGRLTVSGRLQGTGLLSGPGSQSTVSPGPAPGSTAVLGRGGIGPTLAGVAILGSGPASAAVSRTSTTAATATTEAVDHLPHGSASGSGVGRGVP